MFQSKVEPNLQKNQMTSPYIDYKSNYFKADPRDMRIKDVDDLATLEVLDERNVLDTLKNRFSKDIFYVSIYLYFVIMEDGT